MATITKPNGASSVYFEAKDKAGFAAVVGSIENAKALATENLDIFSEGIEITERIVCENEDSKIIGYKCEASNEIFFYISKI